MPFKHAGDTQVNLFKNSKKENCITLNDVIKWLKNQQKVEPKNELLHYMIRSVIKLNNKY